MLRSARNYRFLTLSIAVLIGVAILVFPIAGGGRGSGRFVLAAHAQSNVQEKTIKGGEKIIKDVKSLIERLRNGDVPKGIAKTNGRIESTEVDVSSKYAGRLESVMVDEGDNVKVGQVIARIDSPECRSSALVGQNGLIA
jgi:multidrug efflux pump subunit AcrA (membrane-fusion protein)